jgi:hypothetical protein
MNWVKNQEMMKNRLNETIFKNDPLHFIIIILENIK